MTTASPSFGFFTSSEELGPDQIIAAAKSAEAAGFDRLWGQEPAGGQLAQDAPDPSRPSAHP